MLDQLLRPIKENVLVPIARRIHIHPNTLSTIGLIFGCAAAFACSKRDVSLAMILWILNRIVDGIDGTVARVHRKQSDFGGYYDILCDFLVYSVIPIGLAFPHQSHTLHLALEFMLSSFFVNCASLFYLSSILEKREVGAKKNKELTTITMPKALIEGTETIVFYTAFIAYPDHLFGLYLTFGALVYLNVAQRAVWAWNSL